MRFLAVAVCCFAYYPCLAQTQPDFRPPVQIIVSYETTRLTSPLTHDGRVNYAALLNERNSRGVTPESNAVVGYWQALGTESGFEPGFRDELVSQLGVDVFADPGPHFVRMVEFAQRKVNQGQLNTTDEFYELWNQLDAAVDRTWSEEQFPLVAEWLADNEQFMQRIEAASRRPHYYNPVSERVPLNQNPLPLIIEFRELQRLLSTRVKRHAGEGEFDAAIRDLATMHRIAKHCSRGDSVIERLVAVEFLARTHNCVALLMNQPGISERQLAALQRDLAAIEPLFDPVQTIDECDRWTSLDSIQWCAQRSSGQIMDLIDYSPRPNRKTAYWLDRLLLATDVDWNLSLQQANEIHDRAVGALQRPTYAERISAVQTLYEDDSARRERLRSVPRQVFNLITFRDHDTRAADLMIQSHFPSVGPLLNGWARGEVRRRIAPLGCAIERYRRSNDQYPASLDQLVPEFIAQLPSDPYTDTDFLYKVTADRTRFALYSAGPNGVDDQGRFWSEKADDLGLRSPDWVAATTK